MWRHQLPGDMEGELLDDLQFLITLTPPCHHKDGVSFIGSGNFFFFSLNSWREHTVSAVAFLWGPCARTLVVLLLQFHLLAKHQAPSASLHILPCSIPSKKKEAGAPFYTWDHCVILVMLRVFPFWKDACCQGPTTSKWALCLPAPGFWMQPAALWGLPDMLPFSFHRTGGKLNWEDDTVGNRIVALSLERLQIRSLSNPQVLLAPILG